MVDVISCFHLRIRLASPKSMPIVLEDLGLKHLWIVYPGNLEYPLTEATTALPLKKLNDVSLRAPK